MNFNLDKLRKDDICMKKFWSYVSNGEYCIGTTGQTVYVFNAITGNEIAKFKDLKYAYNVYFSPLKDIFVVKSAEGRLAVYCLENMKLIKKFRFSKIDEAQDEGCCFSKDGKKFYNIEGHGFIHSVIATYNTDTFERINIIDSGDKIEPQCIELDDSGRLFVLGYLRNEDGICRCGFISEFDNKQLLQIYEIPEEEYDFYNAFKNLEIMGFTDKAKKWSAFAYEDRDITGIENWKYPLVELWEKYAR